MIRHRFSKHQYPTYVVSNGLSGSLVIGHESALKALRYRVSRPLGRLVHRHTRCSWYIDEYPKDNHLYNNRRSR